MIHVQQVTDFMADHVIDDRIRRQHDQPIELDASGGRAVAPLAACLAEHHVLEPGLHLQVSRQGAGPCRQHITCLPYQPLLQYPARALLAEVTAVNDELTSFDSNAAVAGGAPVNTKGTALVEYAATLCQPTLLGGPVSLLDQLFSDPFPVTVDEAADRRVADEVWRTHTDSTALHLHDDGTASRGSNDVIVKGREILSRRGRQVGDVLV